MPDKETPIGAVVDDLLVFAAVAESEGFSAAARRLGVSKSMVSAAVARLESRLGVRLLQRTTRRLSLTEAGIAVLPHAQRVRVAAQDAAEAAVSLLTSPRGSLKLNAPMSFGLLHVAPALGAFTSAYPEVQVDLVLDDRVLDLVAGDFDLAIRIGTLPDSSLVASSIGRNRNVLVAHQHYLARAGTPRGPSDLAAHAALVYSLSATGSVWTLSRGSRSESVNVDGPLRVNSSVALREAALQGLGIARLPLFVAGPDLAKGHLQQVLPQWSLPEQGIHLVTTARGQQPRKLTAFAEFLRARIGTPPYWETGSPPRT
jgi:DNA-binding transcriptional LysR family regulator